MEVAELLEFLVKNVPNFENPELVEQEGECYHYTENWKSIKMDGTFKGAPVNEDLDRTQNMNFDLVDSGVVFGYDSIKDAQDEGLGFEIVKIRYRKAIRALHKAEDRLGEFFANAAIETPMEGLLYSSGAPPTLLILTEDIIDFELVITETQIKKIIKKALEENNITSSKNILSIKEITFNKEQIGGDFEKVGNSSIYKEIIENKDVYSAYFNCRIIIKNSSNSHATKNASGSITGLVENDSGELILPDSERVYIDIN